MDRPDDQARWFPPGAADCTADAESPEIEFLQSQLAVIEADLQRFPCEQREFHDLARSEAHAGAYRQQWQLQAANREGCRLSA